MADGVENADGGDCPSNYRQDLSHKFIHWRIVLFVYNVDWLYFCHEHGLLGRLVIVREAWPYGISVIFCGLLAVLGLDNHWNDLEMVEEV